MANKLLFKSGIIFGRSMTDELDMKENHDGIIYLDTPGLACSKLRKQAADAITKALKQGGTYQIFFVITIGSAMLRQEDVRAMKLVLESAPDIKHFGLIINKLSKKAHSILSSNNFEALKTMVTDLLAQVNCINEPPSILLLMYRRELSVGENTFIEWDKLNEFAQKVPSTTINSSCVKEINGEAMDIMNF